MSFLVGTACLPAAPSHDPGCRSCPIIPMFKCQEQQQVLCLGDIAMGTLSLSTRCQQGSSEVLHSHGSSDLKLRAELGTLALHGRY